MRLNPRAVAIGVALGVLSGGGILALGNDGESSSDALASPAGSAPVDDRGALQGLPATPVSPSTATGFPQDESLDVDFSAEGAPAWLVEACRSDAPPAPALHCEAIVAIAEGSLPPGSYSDTELRARLGE